jgi:hypothetical protein
MGRRRSARARPAPGAPQASPQPARRPQHAPRALVTRGLPGPRWLPVCVHPGPAVRLPLPLSPETPASLVRWPSRGHACLRLPSAPSQRAPALSGGRGPPSRTVPARSACPGLPWTVLGPRARPAPSVIHVCVPQPQAVTAGSGWRPVATALVRREPGGGECVRRVQGGAWGREVQRGFGCGATESRGGTKFFGAARDARVQSRGPREGPTRAAGPPPGPRRNPKSPGAHARRRGRRGQWLSQRCWQSG